MKKTILLLTVLFSSHLSALPPELLGKIQQLSCPCMERAIFFKVDQNCFHNRQVFHLNDFQQLWFYFHTSKGSVKNNLRSKFISHTTTRAFITVLGELFKEIAQEHHDDFDADIYPPSYHTYLYFSYDINIPFEEEAEQFKAENPETASRISQNLHGHMRTHSMWLKITQEVQKSLRTRDIQADSINKFRIILAKHLLDQCNKHIHNLWCETFIKYYYFDSQLSG